MFPNEDKFRAETLRIFGIALMTPGGKIFLDPFGLFDRLGLLKFCIVVSYSVLLFYIGLVFIARGYDTISKR